jgi:nucleotide-binding universal stress UspA family protein
MKKSTARIRKILVPVDFSSYSESAVAYASAIAEKFGAALILMHVIEAFPYSVTDTMKVISHRRALQILARALMRNIAVELRNRGLAVKTSLTQGNPSREILATARREKPDLIVMGTHGRTGLPHVLLGSVAEKTVRLSPAPVLTVPLSLDRKAGTAEAHERSGVTLY